MKKLIMFLLTSIMLIRATFGQVVDFSSYHFEGVEAFSFDWENDEVATTSNNFYEISFDKFGYTHLNIQFEEGKTFLVNDIYDIVEYVPYTLDARPVDVVTVNSGAIFISTENGIYNLESGEMIPGIEGYISEEPGNIDIAYDSELNRLYFGGGPINGFGFRDLESGMTTYYEEQVDFPDFGINDFVIADSVLVYIGAGDVWTYNIETSEFGFIDDFPTISGAVDGFTKLNNGSIFVGVGGFDGINRIWIKDGVYQNSYSIIGTPHFIDGQYYLSGSGPVGNNENCYFWYFDPFSGICSPVVASGEIVSDGGAKSVLISDEFWFYSTGINSNITDIQGMYGYPVARLTSDEIVGISDITEASSLSIYPNPATEWVKVSGLSYGDPVWMTDMLGNEIDIVVSYDNTVDIRHLPSGIYFLNGEKVLVQK